MQTRHRSFKTFCEAGITPETAHRLDELWGKKAVLGNIHAVSGSQEDVVCSALASIAQANSNPRADRSNVNDPTSQVDGHLLESVHQPPRPRRTNRALPEPVLKPARQAPEQVRSCHKLANASGSHIGGSIENRPGEFTQTMMKGPGERSLEPMDLPRARNHFCLRTTFTQQRRGFQRTLSAADHEHVLASKFSEVTVFGGVRGQ